VKDDGEMKQVTFCDCGSLDHVFMFTFFDDFPEAYMQIHLPRTRFWSILKRGIMYILFGAESRYGHVDEVLFDHDKAKELRDFLDKFMSFDFKSFPKQQDKQP
jgi:hypothetical protein